MGASAEKPQQAPFCPASGLGSQSPAKTVRPPDHLGGDGGEVFVNEDGAEERSEGDVADSEHEDLAEHCVVRPKLLTSPNPPSKQERLEHEISHLPYRTWCPHCVRGKARCNDHKTRDDDEDRNVPTIGLEYAFLTKSVENHPCRDELTIIVAKQLQEQKRISYSCSPQGQG